MRKLLLTMAVLVAVLTTKAAGYEFLTFELTDGTKASVQASGLAITFNGTTVKAGNQTFTLENLKKMYFSMSDETTGIETVNFEPLTLNQECFDLQGRKVTKEQMRSGQVYIVRTNRGTYKMTLR